MANLPLGACAFGRPFGTDFCHVPIKKTASKGKVRGLWACASQGHRRQPIAMVPPARAESKLSPEYSVLGTAWPVLSTRHSQPRELHRVVASSPATTIQ